MEKMRTKRREVAKWSQLAVVVAVLVTALIFSGLFLLFSSWDYALPTHVAEGAQGAKSIPLWFPGLCWAVIIVFSSMCFLRRRHDERVIDPLIAGGLVVALIAYCVSIIIIFPEGFEAPFFVFLAFLSLAVTDWNSNDMKKALFGIVTFYVLMLMSGGYVYYPLLF